VTASFGLAGFVGTRAQISTAWSPKQMWLFIRRSAKGGIGLNFQKFKRREENLLPLHILGIYPAT